MYTLLSMRVVKVSRSLAIISDNHNCPTVRHLDLAINPTLNSFESHVVCLVRPFHGATIEDELSAISNVVVRFEFFWLVVLESASERKEG